MLARLGLVLRLAEHPPVEDDLGVAADHQSSRGPARPPGLRLAAGVLEHDCLGLALAQLVDLGHDDLERRPRGLE